jgi:hypothetical protein
VQKIIYSLTKDQITNQCSIGLPPFSQQRFLNSPAKIDIFILFFEATEF